MNYDYSLFISEAVYTCDLLVLICNFLCIVLMQARDAYEKVGESTETALIVLVEKLNVFGTDLVKRSKADLASACNDIIKSHFNKVSRIIILTSSLFLTFQLVSLFSPQQEPIS